MILKRSTDNGATFGPAVDLSKYYEGLVNFNGVMDLQLVTSQENNNVYLGWNQPILSPVDYSSSLHSDVVFARVQPALFVQSIFYYNEQLVAPAKQTIQLQDQASNCYHWCDHSLRWRRVFGFTPITGKGL